MEKKLTLISFWDRNTLKERGVFLWMNYNGERALRDNYFWQQVCEIEDKYNFHGVTGNFLDREAWRVDERHSKIR